MNAFRGELSQVPLSIFAQGHLGAPQALHQPDIFALWSLQLLDGTLGPFDPDELRPIYRDFLAGTHPELLVPQDGVQARFTNLLQKTIETDVYARTWTRWPHAGWGRFFRWIWSEVPAPPPESTELHLWFWATCGIDPRILPATNTRARTVSKAQTSA